MSERTVGVEVFARNLRRYREARGWTQGELGSRIGHETGTQVSHYETGRREPSLRTLAALAHALEVGADKLLAGVPSHERRVRVHGRRTEDAVRMAVPRRIGARPTPAKSPEEES